MRLMSVELRRLRDGAHSVLTSGTLTAAAQKETMWPRADPASASLCRSCRVTLLGGGALYMLLHAGLDFLDTSSSAATGRIGVFPCVYTIHRLYVLRELRPHLEGFVAPITLQRAMLCRHGRISIT